MKILLVEDTRSVALVMTARLQSIGHQVFVAENGQRAVERFVELAPELVVMDIDMPVMNGIEATRRIRAIEHGHQFAWTPIIFLTASNSLENLMMAIDAGGDDFLPKSAPEPVLLAKMTAMSRISNLRQNLADANEKLEWLATRDGLTGLFNRRHMNTLIDRLWGDTPSGTNVGLLLIDVDNFKKFNDRYGHQAGDDCLVKVAHAIEQGVCAGLSGNEADSCFGARYGGEEFCIVLDQATPERFDTVDHAMRAALEAFAIPHAQNEAHGIVTLSAGACLTAPAATSIASTFRAADKALYHSKAQGRNRTSYGAVAG